MGLAGAPVLPQPAAPPPELPQVLDRLNRWAYPAHEGFVRIPKDVPILKGYYLVRIGDRPGEHNVYRENLGCNLIELKGDRAGIFDEYWVYRRGRNANEKEETKSRDYVCRVKPLPLP